MARPTRSRSLAAVILAAGKGKRLKSSTPKVLHPICGRPALWWVLDGARAVRPSRIVIVVHHGADEVREAVRSWGIVPEPVFVEQGEALGTGHAVLVAEKAIGRVDEVLVANGDFDPVTPADVRALLGLHRRRRAAATILTTEVDRPGSYSRIVREGTRLVSIVEGSDAPARDAGDPRGRDQLDRVPPRRPVPGAAAGRPGQPPGRVLPERRLPDPHGQGGGRRRSAVDTAGRCSAPTRATGSRRSRASCGTGSTRGTWPTA